MNAGILDSLLNLLFPPKCPFCGTVLDQIGICNGCRSKLPWAEGSEALRNSPGGLRVCAPLRYEGLAREGVLDLKFHGRMGAAEPLGELVAACAAEWYSGEFDMVTWVPVSKQRLRKRGYDQAELLARSACRAWDVRPVRLLVKTVDNPAQSGLHEAAARRANVLGVYEAAEPTKTAGRRILLVDDVCTTGSTLAECAQVLREAGAAEVLCAAVALTSRPDGK